MSSTTVADRFIEMFPVVKERAAIFAAFSDLPSEKGDRLLLADNDALKLLLAELLTAPAQGAAQAGAALPNPSQRRLDHSVQRVYVDDKAAGTCFVLTNGVVVTAAHCVMDSDVVCTNIKGFGAALVCMFADLEDDCAFLKPKDGEQLRDAGPGFELQGLRNYDGVITLIGYPQATDRLSGTGPQLPAPLHTRGRVAAWSQDGRVVIADYSGALPNASGGAVVGQAGQLLGMHGGLVWHDPTDKAEDDNATDKPTTAAEELDDARDTADTAEADNAEETSPTSATLTSTSPAATLSPSSTDEDTNSLELKLQACDLRLQSLEDHVPHKGSLPYFVPSEVLVRVMIANGALPAAAGADAYRVPLKRLRTFV